MTDYTIKAYNVKSGTPINVTFHNYSQEESMLEPATDFATALSRSDLWSHVKFTKTEDVETEVSIT